MKKVFLGLCIAACFSVKVSAQAPDDVSALLKKHTCVSCHKVDKKGIGPNWTEIAQKKYTVKEIITLVYEPKPEHWPGYVSMAALPQVPKADLKKIASWIKTLEEK